MASCKHRFRLVALGEQVLGGSNRPDDVIWPDAAQRVTAGSCTPAGEVDLMRQYGGSAHSSASWAGLTRRDARGLLSSDPRG